ncbi:MAG: hypothetical protein KGL39_49505 [Patescibacteria group bacterium]|nr:hypothetical protein [Patescibacteria group bacterium]
MRHPNSSAGSGLGGRAKGNFGQQNKGSKSPMSGASPMETAAPGERWKNQPKGPSIRGGRGLEAQPTVDKVSRADVAKHTGRN